MSRNESDLKSAAKDFVAGALAGVAQIASSHPLDTIKTRLQARSTVGSQRYTSGWDCFIKTIKNEGIRGLYKGMLSPVAGVAFVNAILFGAYGRMKSLIHSDPKTPLTIGEIAICGAGAGVANSFVASPIELIKARLQIQTNALSKQYSGPVDCARQILAQEGARGLYRGLGATVLREIPAYAAWYAVYESMRRYLTPSGATEIHPIKLMFSGAVGGMAYWTACYPLDVAKTLIQTASAPASSSSSNSNSLSTTTRRYTSTIQTLQLVISEEGIRGLYRGYLPSIARAIPAASCTFLTFETVTKLLKHV